MSTESFSKEENINVKQQKEKGGAKEGCHICKLQWVELDRHSFPFKRKLNTNKYL